MNRSDRDPDAYDRIRDDKLTEQKPEWYVSPDVIGAGMKARLQEQAARIAELESELKTMTSAADDRIRDDASVLGRTCGYCGFTGDMMAYAQHVCPRDVMQSEIDSLRAQLATVRSELAMVEAGAGVIEAQRDELQRALKAKTDWVEKVGERAAKLASRIASNDYEVQAMESLANELAAATERERRINQRAEILFDGIQGAHDMVTRWLANPSAPATEKLIELAGMLETRMDMTEQPGAAALAASEKGRE